jgi:uncharacterized membrane protein YcaP (DUF421 family)
MFMPAVDWQSMFVPTESVLEVVIRGTIMYLGMYFILRIFRRQAGSIGIADLLVIVVDRRRRTERHGGRFEIDHRGVDIDRDDRALGLFSGLAWLRFTFVDRYLTPNPLLLIKDGKPIKKNLEKELISDDELMSQLRQQGIEEIDLVREGYLESNGHFSFLTRSKEPRNKGNAGWSGGRQLNVMKMGARKIEILTHRICDGARPHRRRPGVSWKAS